MIDLNTVWFLILSFLLIGYVVLDGFDLGVGVLHLFARNEDERRIHLNAIAPVWDGNEVWLITAGGAMFAAFPRVYATAFSSFYLAFVLLLTALIFRAVAMEFREKVESHFWRRLWDRLFGLGSLLAAILFGVAFGNIVRGLPLDVNGVYTGTFWTLLNPYALLIGIFALAVFTLHGALYMLLKTDGALQERIQKYASGALYGFLSLYIFAAIATIFAASSLLCNILSNPLFWIFFITLSIAIIYIPVAVNAKKFFRAFLASSAVITCLFGLAAVSLFPRLIPSSINLAYSLTIYNASSTGRTLTVMLVIAIIGMPLVIGYTVYIYRVFKGKVVITDSSY